MAVVCWLIERDEGAIAMALHLLPAWYGANGGGCPEDHLAEHEGVASAMDELHLRKIDLADEVFVVNRNDYIGNSTRREIEYAMKLGKPIRWYNHHQIKEKIESMLSAAPPAGEGKPTLTYPPEPHSWVAVKGDKPTVVVEKAAYDDLRARFVALRKKT
jgi:hypothetical protein